MGEDPNSSNIFAICICPSLHGGEGKEGGGRDREGGRERGERRGVRRGGRGLKRSGRKETCKLNAME